MQATIYNSTSIIGLIQPLAGTLPAVPALLLDGAHKCQGIYEGGMNSTVEKREELFSLPKRAEQRERTTRDRLILDVHWSAVYWGKLSGRLVLQSVFLKSVSSVCVCLCVLRDGVVVGVLSQRCGDGGGVGRSVCAGEGCLQAERTAHPLRAGCRHRLLARVLPAHQAAF